MTPTYPRRFDSRRSVLYLTSLPMMGAACALIGWILLQPLVSLAFSRRRPLGVVLAVTVAALGAPPLTAASRTSR